MSEKKSPSKKLARNNQTAPQLNLGFPKGVVHSLQNMTKRYYSIGEVAQMFGVNTSLLRYWETEFPSLNPKKNRQGKRLYTQKDIEKVKLIYSLVKERGYTLEGAKNKLKGSRNELDNQLRVVKTLEDIRAFLVTMRDQLDD